MTIELRGMGWYDPEPGLPARVLHRKIGDGRDCLMDAMPDVVGAGRNVVGMTLVIRLADKGRSVGRNGSSFPMRLNCCQKNSQH